MNEFGPLPDGAEGLSLAALGEGLESDRPSQLGKQSSSLIARLISSKMPARFNLSAARDHLNSTWGLGPSRQSSVLLFAITAEPLSRLQSIQAAKEYLDSLTLRYAKSCGLILQARSSQNDAQQAPQKPVDSACLEVLSKEQQSLAAKQFRVLAEYLNVEAGNPAKLAELEIMQKDLQERLDLWNSEFAEDFASGIQPCFDTRKCRRFNSSWNLARQEVLGLYHDAGCGRLQEGINKLEAKLFRIANRSDESLLTLVKSLTALSSKQDGPAAEFSFVGRKLLDSVSNGICQPPVFRPRLPMMGPQTCIAVDGTIEYKEVPRSGPNHPRSYPELLKSGSLHSSKTGLPYVHLKSRRNSEWRLDFEKTDNLMESLSDAFQCGMSFANKDVLVTGAGPGSIGIELVRGLLSGGARVIVTTSRAPSETSRFYQEVYEDCGSRGSELVVIPSNQGSIRDCEALIDHIYSDSGLRRNLDAIIPFAAISERGVEIDGLEAKSELAHRLMLVNVLRLLGRVIRNKNERNFRCRPTQVLLPLSPNHGTFGGDGLYSESKLGLEGLLNRFHSESWSDELTVCGVIIGWTRGTGLMSDNDIIAEAIESKNILTFSQQEIAFNILILMTPTIVNLCEDEPVVADFGGGLGLLENCKAMLSQARAEIDSAAEVVRAVKNENSRQLSLLRGTSSDSHTHRVPTPVKRRPTLGIGFPSLPDLQKDLKPLQHLQGMIDTSSTVVIVGFSELGPWGSSRTRWDIERQGKLTQEGYIEMAWIMNLIRHFDGEAKGKHYVGWVDAETGEQVPDDQIEEKYGTYILDNSGIRLVDPELFDGYDPEKKEYLQEIAVEEDLPEFDATLATAEAFKLRHREHVTIRQLDGPDEYRVQIKSGAHILVPKAVPFSRGVVAGQIPKGWDPAKYGIQEDLISQADPVTLYTLCCVSEALYSAGITDSLEIFKYIHLSEMGNFIGSSMGGTMKASHMYKDMFLDKQIQGDVIQETYLNTPAAWVNMLLLGSAGPIKTPVGACATGVESIDIGYESILSGKTRMCLVGGTDNFQEDESYGFSTMNATVNAAQEFANGRVPAEMSRPTAESRAGFLESQGCGVQIICRADLALEMGLPIHGVIASSTMAADKISRSVPAPGQGVLTFARETHDAAMSPLLNMEYRREQMQMGMSQTRFRRDVNSEIRYGSSDTGTNTPDSMDSTDSDLSQHVVIDFPSSDPFDKAAASARFKAAQKLWGHDFRLQDPNISPLRASLAVWGLTIDDLDVASLHGTSTKANDKNEPEVINKQMTHLGRTAGRPLLAICQKSITGHPKAPAAAWMLNGCLQTLNTGTVPGNSNADNVDMALRQFEHLVFPTRPIQTREVKAFLLTSFGFGQKGGQIVGIAPKYLFASLSHVVFENYSARVTVRQRLANRAYVQALFSNTVFTPQLHPPYEKTDESKVFLDPLSRVSEAKTGVLSFDIFNLRGNAKKVPTTFNPFKDDGALPESSSLTVAASASKGWIERVTQGQPDASYTVGVDVEDLNNFASDNDPLFVSRNYTEEERLLASRSIEPHATFVGRWCAKEAVFKSFGVVSKGAEAALKDIEVLGDEGVPKVRVSPWRNG
jgi:fatty acid synthase subunit alpha, fungi type